VPGEIKKEGFMRFSSDQLSNIMKYPPIPADTEKPDEKDVDLKLMKPKNLDELPPALNKKGNFRKNSQFAEGGAIPTPDSFYFRINGESIYYTET